MELHPPPGESSSNWNDSIEELQVNADVEAEQLQELLLQIQSIGKMEPEVRKKKLAALTESIQKVASKEDLQQLFDAFDVSLNDYIGDPRHLYFCLIQLLDYFKLNPEKTQIIVQRYLQDKQGGPEISPSPFDWTMVDILLSQLSHLSGENAIFTKEMRDSVVFSLFPTNGDGHFLQDLVFQFLTLSIGEKITIVRQRMQNLSQAPLSKVTLLSNMLVEIHERYEKEVEKLTKNIPETIIEKMEP